jgi:hypothetical protein
MEAPILGNVWKNNLIDLPVISEKSIWGKERVSAMGFSISFATEFATPKTWLKSLGLRKVIQHNDLKKDKVLSIF